MGLAKKEQKRLQLKKLLIKRYKYALLDSAYNMMFLFGPANISNIPEDFKNRKRWTDIFPNNQLRTGKYLNLHVL